MKSVPARLIHRPHAGCLLLFAAWMVSWCPPLSAQTTLKPRGERLPQPAKLRTLAVRESTLTSVMENATAVYRKEAASPTFVLESSEGEARLEWKIGGEIHPLPEGLEAPAPRTEKRIRLIPHQDKLFLKIETATRPDPADGGKEIRFSGTYEASVLEGSWADHLATGAMLKLRIAAGDHDRYLGDITRAHFDEATLARHAARYREQLTGLLEGKVAAPGDAPAAEVELARALVALVKTHPGTFVVTVTPAFTADPEIFMVEGATMRSTTARQASILRYEAKLPALAPARP